VYWVVVVAETSRNAFGHLDCGIHEGHQRMNLLERQVPGLRSCAG